MTAAKKRMWRTDAFSGTGAKENEIVFMCFTTTDNPMTGVLHLRQLRKSYTVIPPTSPGTMEARIALALMAAFEQDCRQKGYAQINPVLEKNFIRLERDGVFHNALPHNTHSVHVIDWLKKTAQGKPGLKIRPR